MPSYLIKPLRLAAFLIAAVVSSAEAGSLNAIYVFGDSLSDAGNAFIAAGVPLPPYSNGRFSNGNVGVQDIALGLGLPALTPSLAGGTDYAVGGAQTGSANPGDLAYQLAAFKAANPVANPNGLYTIWIGANDLDNATPANATAVALNAVGNIDAAINTLAAAGAKNFLVLTVPDLGKTPAAIAGGPAVVAGASQLAAFFDTTLVNGLGSAGIPSLGTIAGADGLNLNILDTYSLIDGITANPAAFGLTDVTDPCLTGENPPYSGGGTVCANPNQYLFWDQLHPTAAGAQILANAALQVIPEPSTAALMMAAGVVAFVVVRRRVTRVA